MKKKLIVLLALLLVFTGIVASYKVIARNEIENKTYEFLKNKGYTRSDISDIETKHSFTNKLLGYNEWRIFVEFESEPDIIFAFTYRNHEIIRQGVTGNSSLNKDEILDYENKLDNGKLKSQ